MSKKSTSRQSATKWDRVDSIKEEDIDLSEDPELTPEMFSGALVRKGLKPVPRKKQITLRIDEDVLDWFRRRGRGYQTQINELLREYMKAHDAQEKK